MQRHQDLHGQIRASTVGTGKTTVALNELNIVYDDDNLLVALLHGKGSHLLQLACFGASG
jgi:hypothetical protein